MLNSQHALPSQVMLTAAPPGRSFRPQLTVASQIPSAKQQFALDHHQQEQHWQPMTQQLPHSAQPFRQRHGQTPDQLPISQHAAQMRSPDQLPSWLLPDAQAPLSQPVVLAATSSNQAAMPLSSGNSDMTTTQSPSSSDAEAGPSAQGQSMPADQTQQASSLPDAARLRSYPQAQQQGEEEPHRPAVAGAFQDGANSMQHRLSEGIQANRSAQQHALPNMPLRGPHLPFPQSHYHSGHHFADRNPFGGTALHAPLLRPSLSGEFGSGRQAQDDQQTPNWWPGAGSMMHPAHIPQAQGVQRILRQNGMARIPTKCDAFIIIHACLPFYLDSNCTAVCNASKHPCPQLQSMQKALSQVLGDLQNRFTISI